MKSKRLNYIFIGIGISFLTGFVLFVSTQIEPSYNGKSLSEWLEEGRLSQPRQIVDPAFSKRMVKKPPDGESAKAAIEAMGEDAVPFLVRSLKSRRGPLSKKLRDLAAKVGIALPHPSFEFERTLYGFKALGEVGVPALLELLDRNDPDLRLATLICLSQITSFSGDEVDVIANVLLNDPQFINRFFAAQILGNIGSTREIVNALIQGLRDTEADVRLGSALALGRFNKEAVEKTYGLGTIRHALANWDGDTFISYGDISPAATNAIPALESALNDSDNSVRAAARFALDEIEKANMPEPLSILPASEN